MSLLPSWPTVAAGLVIGLAAGAFGMHTWDARKYDALVAKQAAALALANAANQKKADELQDTVDTLNTAAVLKDEEHAKDIDSVRAAARSGAVRLSIPSSCGSKPSTQASTTTGPGAEERADILPGTADALVRIAGDSAKSVFDYNRLLDQYNAVCK